MFSPDWYFEYHLVNRKPIDKTTESIIIFLLHFLLNDSGKSWRNTNSDRTMISPPAGIRLALFVCCSTVYYIPVFWYILRMSISGVSKLPVIHVRMLPPVSVLLIITVSPSQLCTDRFDFFRPCHLVLWFHFQIRVVVINSQVNPRHVTVPVNLLCRTVIKHVVNISRARSLPLSSPTTWNLHRVSPYWHIY